MSFFVNYYALEGDDALIVLDCIKWVQASDYSPLYIYLFPVEEEEIF